MKRTIRVPLAVDATVRIPIGSFMFPMRAIAIAALTAPVAYFFVTLDAIPATWRMMIAAFIMLIAATLSIPTKEGVWIGTWSLYQHAFRIVPSVVDRGQVRRARVELRNGGVNVSNVRGAFSSKRRYISKLN